MKESMDIVNKWKPIKKFDEELFLRAVEQIAVVDGKKKVIVKLLVETELKCTE